VARMGRFPMPQIDNSSCCPFGHGDATGTHMIFECCDRHHDWRSLCTFAIVIGTRVGAWVGKRARVVGGIILLAMAARILVSHIG